RGGLLSWVGLLLFAGAILLMALSMRTLGNAFTVRLGVQQGQRLVTSGPYRVIRHPGYLSYFITFLGIGLSMSSLIMLVLTILSIPFFVWRIQHEEQMLITEFGDEYKTYKQQTKWRLIPLIY
ncbi:MAG: isoprenylcysteine carboxylmethyltransferase family protein, partial [Candidatus Bathyarchaeota archaeon]|nr:isoprenylcysteine carboxylmethyltransferase family protein [Candidatus Bathyarchaeota archaeon]